MKDGVVAIDPHSPDGLDELIAFAVSIGVDARFVQGAGGNFSVKSHGVVWVKASGTRLADAATRPIFVPVDEERARPAVLRTESLGEYVLAEQAPAGLRPSIETAFHVLLPHRYVAHLHPTGAIALGLDGRIVGRFGELYGGMAHLEVPYAKPGIQLARAIDARLPSDLAADQPIVILLRNHGLVVAASTVQEIADMVERVRPASPPPEAVATGVPGVLPGFELLAPAGTVDDAALTILARGPLTPDAAVFLGARPFTSSAERSSSTACVVLPDGSVEVAVELGPDEREIAVSMLDVGRLLSGSEPGRVLDDREIRELIDWDAEKWRRGMRR